MGAKFYVCEHCGNLVGMIHDSGVPMMCCGQKMTALLPNTVEASGEKHKPVVKVEGNTVTVNVGAVNHPMAPEHFIEWVYVQTENGGQRKALKPDDKPNDLISKMELFGSDPKSLYMLNQELATRVYSAPSLVL